MEEPYEEWVKDYKFTRHYFLRDHHQEPPRWVGHLECLARDLAPHLARVRLRDVTHRNVVKCRVFHAEEKLVYHFEREKSTKDYVCGINAIYSDMSLRGLWPWPKAPEEDNGNAAQGALPSPRGYG
ncbi:uncharacterized protein PG986_008590 [Apiospora aurea]|uniref:Uncharacterized protein n=1 Tax=Apiospora aurea TaxID=335848 RepID=A0ABR1Q591_9PEZI